MTTTQLDNQLTARRSIEVPAQRRGIEADLERACYFRGVATTTYWYLLYMFTLGLFGAVVVVLGAELW